MDNLRPVLRKLLLDQHGSYPKFNWNQLNAPVDFPESHYLVVEKLMELLAQPEWLTIDAPIGVDAPDNLHAQFNAVRKCLSAHNSPLCVLNIVPFKDNYKFTPHCVGCIELDRVFHASLYEKAEPICDRLGLLKMLSGPFCFVTRLSATAYPRLLIETADLVVHLIEHPGGVFEVVVEKHRGTTGLTVYDKAEWVVKQLQTLPKAVKPELGAVEESKE
jgi:hypothetical protein